MSELGFLLSGRGVGEYKVWSQVTGQLQLIWRMTRRLAGSRAVAWIVVAAPLLLPPAAAGAASFQSEVTCATRALQDNSVERLPSNYAANRTDAADGTSFADAPVSYQRRVTGNFSGTTQQILRWASCKWRIDPLLTFAQAAQESGWRQAATGDGGDSYGILQLRRSTWPDSYPRSAVSTAWNADASRMYLRACIDGKFASWGLEGYLSTKGQERVWYCVGVYFAGEGPSDANGGNAYVASVKRYLANRTWELGGT